MNNRVINFISFRRSRFGGLIILLTGLFAGVNVFSQTDYFLSSSDDEIAIELTREQQTVNIALFLFKASKFEFVSIERSLDAQNNFSQCKYIKFNESAQDSVVIVKKDLYPQSNVDAVYYRVKTVTRDGATRIYPSVRLPAISETSEN